MKTATISSVQSWKENKQSIPSSQWLRLAWALHWPVVRVGMRLPIAFEFADSELSPSK